MKWYLKALRQYADFNGRADRKEYWMFVLFNLIFGIAALFIGKLAAKVSPVLGYGVLYGLYGLATLIPGLAVSLRRLHDTGKSGWMLLTALIPLIGAVWLLVLRGMEGSPDENKYGPAPECTT